MIQAIILECRPSAMFHFGRVAVDADTSLDDTSEIPHSDTLFSAIVNLAARIFDPMVLKDFLKLFGLNESVPKIRISSGFYCLENQSKEYLYFLPKPLNYNLIKTNNQKALKKIQFISKSVWEKGLKPSDWFTKCKVIDKKFVVTDDEWLQFKLNDSSKLYSTISLPKVAVHKDTKSDSFYYQTNLQLADNGSYNKVHFYFLIDTSDLQSEEVKMLNEVLNLLPYEGIGGERSTGCGIFEGLTKENFNLLMVKESTNFVSVSLTNPCDQNEFDSFKNYQILVRGGRRIGNSDGKFLNKVNMIAEGAVTENKVKGRIVSISPPNDKDSFLRNGISFVLPHSN